MDLKPITETALDDLQMDALAARMDGILAAPYWERFGNEIMKLRVSILTNTKRVQSFAPEFQRKVAYKTFGLLLQLFYTNFSISAKFFNLSGKEEPSARQLHNVAREQWTVISSRIAFEYFMQLVYMLDKGYDFGSPKSTFNKLKKWLKEPRNPYTYFSITVARAAKYDRSKRTPEVHGGTKLARRILLLDDHQHDAELLSLFNTIRNQWQFVIDVADERSPNGWAASGNVTGDKEWYKLWKSGDEVAINREIDSMFDDALCLNKKKVAG